MEWEVIFGVVVLCGSLGMLVLLGLLLLIVEKIKMKNQKIAEGKEIPNGPPFIERVRDLLNDVQLTPMMFIMLPLFALFLFGGAMAFKMNSGDYAVADAKVLDTKEIRNEHEDEDGHVTSVTYTYKALVEYYVDGLRYEEWTDDMKLKKLQKLHQVKYDKENPSHLYSNNTLKTGIVFTLLGGLPSFICVLLIVLGIRNKIRRKDSQWEE